MEEPKWNFIDTINGGKRFENGDAIPYAELNKIIENMYYLKNKIDGGLQ